MRVKFNLIRKEFPKWIFKFFPFFDQYWAVHACEVWLCFFFRKQPRKHKLRQALNSWKFFSLGSTRKEPLDFAVAIIPKHKSSQICLKSCLSKVVCFDKPCSKFSPAFGFVMKPETKHAGLPWGLLKRVPSSLSVRPPLISSWPGTLLCWVALEVWGGLCKHFRQSRKGTEQDNNLGVFLPLSILKSVNYRISDTLSPIG